MNLLCCCPFVLGLGITGSALSQVSPSPLPAATLTVRVGPTPDVEKSMHFANGLVATSQQPDILVLDGARRTDLTVGKSKRPQYQRVPTQGRYVLVQHTLNGGLESFDYLVQGTDSVSFTYTAARPQATVLNRAHRPYDYQVEHYFYSRLVKDRYSPLVPVLYPMYFHDYTKKSPPQLASWSLARRLQYTAQLKLGIQQQAYAGASALLRTEDRLLDSLYQAQQLSDQPYAFYKDKVRHLRGVLEVETNRVTTAQVPQLLTTGPQRAPSLPSPYRQLLLRVVADKFVTSQAPALDLKDGVNRDYRQVYTLLQASTLFAPADQEYLLAREFRRIGQTFSAADFRRFFTQFAHQAQDTTLVAALRADYALEFEASRTATTSVVLLDQQGTKRTLTELLRQQAGQVVYVDFWASWCVPCREALPASRRLRKTLRGKEVVVVYVSLDKTLPPWRAASNQEQLAAYAQSYVAVNYPHAAFFQRHRLTAIPRYMIFDKQGQLVQAQAPSAESPRLVDLLTKLAR